MGCGSSQSLLLKKNTISILNEPSCYLWKEYRSTYKNLSQSSTLKTQENVPSDITNNKFFNKE